MRSFKDFFPLFTYLLNCHWTFFIKCLYVFLLNSQQLCMFNHKQQHSNSQILNTLAGIWTSNLLFQKRCRWPLRHAARTCHCLAKFDKKHIEMKVAIKLSFFLQGLVKLFIPCMFWQVYLRITHYLYAKYALFSLLGLSVIAAFQGPTIHT
jgi:hypothetical protein